MIQGTATTTLVPGSGLTGWASCDSSDLSADLTGTTTTDYTVVAAWTSTDRTTTVKVLVNGETIRGLMGDVVIERNTDSIPATATFTVADPRACMMASDSIIRGAQPVEIRLYCDGQEWVAFRGVIESVSNEDHYRPRASVKAVSVSAEVFVHNTAGCVRATPFSGQTRAALLEAYAAAAGVTLDMTGVPSRTLLRLPVDISGVTIQDLLLRWGELEGWYCRETLDGELEILTEAEVVGARAKWDLLESAYLSLREDGPNRPITVLSIGGSQITLAREGYEAPVTYCSIATSSGPGGETKRIVTDATYQYGVLLSSTVTEFGIYAPKGITLLTETFRMIARTSDTYTYAMTAVDGVYIPTTQLLSSSHVVEGWYSPLAAIGPGYQWTDGSHHAGQYETFRVTGETDLTQTYSAADAPIPCRLTGKTEVAKGYYAPQSFPPAGGSLTITQAGTPGTTSYSYSAVFYDANGAVLGVTGVVTTTTGAAVLNATDYNIITVTAPAGGGVASLVIERVSLGGGSSVTTRGSIRWVGSPSFPAVWGDYGQAAYMSALAVYDDGTYRTTPYTWGEMSRLEESYSDNLAQVEAGTTGERINRTDRTVWAWVVESHARPPYPPLSVERYETDYTESIVQSGVPNASWSWLTKSKKIHDGTSEYSRVWQSQKISDPVVAPATLPQYSQTAMVYTLSAWTSLYPIVSRTETATDAENLTELERVARRRMREDLGFRVTVAMRAVPFLLPWDTVAVYDSVRGYTGKVGWVERLSTKVNVLNGWFAQDATIVIPPEGV